MTLYRWASAQGRTQGASHRRAGKPCQDQTALIRGPGWLAAALSDGAGSAAQAETGAWIAAQSAAHAAAARLAAAPNPKTAPLQNMIRESFQVARMELQRYAARRQHKIRDYNCTLLVGIAAGNLAAAGQIGDGHAVAQQDEGSFQTVTEPHQGEYANETLFLTAPNALQQLHVAEAPGTSQSLVLSSDGLQRLIMNIANQEPHQLFFKTLTQWLNAQPRGAAPDQQLHDALEAIANGGKTDDDLSLVVAVREQEGEA